MATCLTLYSCQRFSVKFLIDASLHNNQLQQLLNEKKGRQSNSQKSRAEQKLDVRKAAESYNQRNVKGITLVNINQCVSVGHWGEIDKELFFLIWLFAME